MSNDFVYIYPQIKMIRCSFTYLTALTQPELSWVDDLCVSSSRFFSTINARAKQVCV